MRRHTSLLAALLLAALAAQLSLFVARTSQTWDEGDHLYAGYRSLTDGDFGLNPEHPPFVKMLAALPLLAMHLDVPALQNRYFKHEAFLGGREFLARNGIDRVLAPARLAAALLTLLTGLIAFLAAREMFGPEAGLFALALLAFDPNLIAHGAVVTTDMGLSCFMFASVYAFYRYVKAPSPGRLLLVGLAAGMALASKHTGILVLPMLALLALAEWRTLRPARVVGSLAGIAAVAVLVLWAFYGFRFAARPAGLAVSPAFADSLAMVPKPHQALVLSTLGRFHVLPESYLYGLGDVLFMDSIYTSYVLGKAYPHGVWFYFPVAYAVKSTLAFLALPLVIVGAVAAGAFRARREILFLAIPPVVHFAVATSSHMNIGVRHILPVYVFLAVLGAGAFAALVARDRRWLYAAAVVLGVHVVSALRALPNTDISYANELWGGPNQSYRQLSDSNSDWAQQLKSLKRYLDGRGVRDCWFAYFGHGTVDWRDYGIPCRALPTADGFWLREIPQVPAAIDGTVVISAGVLASFEFGPGALDPYAGFDPAKAVAQIDGGLFVFDGHFQIPLASALALAERAEARLGAGQAEDALEDALEAVALAPAAVKPNTIAGDALVKLGRGSDARAYYDAALRSARTIEPEFQAGAAAGLDAKLARLGRP